MTRESTVADLDRAWRKVNAKALSEADRGRLKVARDAWKASTSATGRGPGRPRSAPAQVQGAEPSEVPSSFGRKDFRIRGHSVLLTYQSFAEFSVWERFKDFVEGSLRTWKVKYWCCTMETNMDGRYHIHCMLQFQHHMGTTLQDFAFEGRRSNGQAEDLLAQAVCRKRMQQSID